MRTSAREKYGSGPSLSTRKDIARQALRVVLTVIQIGVIAALIFGGIFGIMRALWT